MVKANFGFIINIIQAKLKLKSIMDVKCNKLNNLCYYLKRKKF